MDLTLAMLTLGASQLLVGGLTVLFLFCSVLLILTVLIQRPQGGGLSGAFGAGGGGSGETAFGARTGDALTIATIAFFIIWLLVAIGLVWTMSGARGGGDLPGATSTDGPAAPAQTEPAQGGGAGAETPPAPEGEGAPAGEAGAEAGDEAGGEGESGDEGDDAGEGASGAAGDDPRDG
jgi:preprotein translocase subunit SecG